MGKSAERFQQLSTKYLAPLETTKGNLEFSGPLAAEMAEKLLKKREDYIGVVPIGSMLGYPARKSDIDPVLLMENKESKSTTGTSSTTFISSAMKRMFETEMANKIRDKLRWKRDIHCIGGYIDEDSIAEAIDLSLHNHELPSESGFWLQIFSPAAIGEHRDEWINLIGIGIKGLSVDERSKVIKGFAGAIVYVEKKSEPKFRERARMSKEETEQLSANRQRLWEKQIAVALGVQEL